MGRYIRFIAALALFGLGCEADPLPILDASGGTGGQVDGTAGTGGIGGDGGNLDPDMAPEPEPDMAVDLDMAVVADMAPEPDLAVDMEVDLGDIEEVDPPDFDLVAVTRRGSDTFFFWVDATGQLVSLEVDDAGRAAEPIILEQPAVPPERVVAREVAGSPWVAHGAEGVPVVLFQADLPQATRLVLDELYGPPMLAATGDGVLVIARNEAGDLAWQRVSNDLEIEELVVDTFGLDLPDDAAGVPAGVVLYYGGAGQCIQLGELDWRPTGNFACPAGDGRLISDGRTALATHVNAFGADQVIQVKPIYDDDNDYLISYLELQAGLRFGDDGMQRPLVGARILDGNRIRRLALSFVSPYETWDSVATWLDTSTWPFGSTRALARRTLPDRAARVGLCESGLECVADEDCEVGACEFTETTEFGVALEFRRDGAPRVRLYPLLQRNVLDPPYGIDQNRGCIPEVERCDLLDQDCDGRADDGRCCEGTAEISYRWDTVLPVARIEVDGEQRYEMLIADVERNDAYRVLYRYADTDRWEGKVVSLIQDRTGTPGNLGIRITGAVEGKFLLGGSGFTSLIARQAEEDGTPGGWALFTVHPTRDEPGEDPPRPLIPLDCDEVLAADVMNPPDAPIEQAGQVVVVCRDKILHLYPVDADRDRVYPLATFEILPIDWASIHRSGVAELQLLMGYRVPGNEWVVRSLEMDGQGVGGPSDSLVPSQLDTAGPADAIWPLYRHPVPGRPPVQIRDETHARVPFQELDDNGNRVTVWRDLLLAPEPELTVFSPTEFRVFSAGPTTPDNGFDEATGWWAADVTGNGGVYNLWSTEPVFTVNGPIVQWYATKGSYDRDSLNVDIGRYDLVIVTPTDDSDRRFRLISRETRCIRP